MIDEIERVWIKAARSGGVRPGRRTPGTGITRMLVSLYRDGAAYGSELARRTEQSQGNVVVWLRKLSDLGFAQVADEIPGLGHQGGGRPAIEWELTRAGEELAELIINSKNTLTRRT